MIAGSKWALQAENGCKIIQEIANIKNIRQIRLKRHGYWFI